MYSPHHIYDLGEEDGTAYQLIVDHDRSQMVGAVSGQSVRLIAPGDFYDERVRGKTLAELIRVRLCPGVAAATIPTPAGPIALRSFGPEDAEGLAAIQFNPDSMRYLGGAAQGDKQKWITDFQERFSGWNEHYAAVCSPQGPAEVLGRVGFLDTSVPDEPEFFIVLAPKLVGQKVGRALASELIRQAFAHPNPAALRAGADPTHNASIALLSWAGFTGAESQTGADEFHGRLSFRLRREDARRRLGEFMR